MSHGFLGFNIPSRTRGYLQHPREGEITDHPQEDNNIPSPVKQRLRVYKIPKQGIFMRYSRQTKSKCCGKPPASTCSSEKSIP